MKIVLSLDETRSALERSVKAATNLSRENTDRKILILTCKNS